MTKNIIVVGTGPAGLMAGTRLLERGFKVHFYDQKSTPGRKFLVAGNGGFNLTHSESIENFVLKYNRKEIQEAVNKFSNQDFIGFLEKIKVETYVGSSGKIFPKKGMKPIEVLQKWIQHIEALGGKFHFNYKFENFDETHISFTSNNITYNIEYQNIVFSLGGCSWGKTGSTGTWLETFRMKEINCINFQASNSGFEIENWNKLKHFEGNVIKNCEVIIGNTIKKGEVVFTQYGLEGNPIYHLNKCFRDEHISDLFIDFKPTKSEKEIQVILQNSKNTTEGLKNLKFPKFLIQFIKESTSKEDFMNIKFISNKIKEYKFKVLKLREIDEVISTIGGISIEEINSKFQLKKHPSISVCGEMLDWDAPTGGYLIQGCVSTGYMVGDSII